MGIARIFRKSRRVSGCRKMSHYRVHISKKTSDQVKELADEFDTTARKVVKSLVRRAYRDCWTIHDELYVEIPEDQDQ